MKRTTTCVHRGFFDRRNRPLLLLILLTACLAALAPGVALAGEAVHTTSIGGLTLPEYIGELEFIGERSGAEPGSVASYSYRSLGMALDIQVTDLGANGIADGADSEELRQRYDEAKQALVASTPVQGLKPASELTVSLGVAPAREAREALYRVAPMPSDETELESDAARADLAGGSTYLWFTAAHGLVIAARFDVAAGLEEDGAISRGEVLAALGGAIPATADAVVQARARAAESADAALKVAILWDPETPEAESRIWLAYLFARAAYAATGSEGGPTVGEREATFEEEVRGRTIAVSTFRELKRGDARLASTYFNDIERVMDAGFLREYVWSYLRNPSWAKPEGLKLEAFNEWRAAHLPAHVPVTHGRIAFRLASAQ